MEPDTCPKLVKPTPRRALLGHALGLPVAALAPSWQGTPPVAAQAGPDAELIRLIAEFAALEHRFLAAHDDISDDDERDAFIGPIIEAQKPLLDRILTLRATTLPGFLARAKLLGLYEPEWTKEENILSDGGSHNERMAGALIRDMLAMGDAA